MYCCHLVCICCILCLFVVSYVYLLYYVCIAVLTLDAWLLARSQYPEGPATGHLDTGFSWFPCVYKRMLRWFPSFQAATTCLSCSPPNLNFLVTFFSMFVYMQYNHCHRVITQLQLINIIIINRPGTPWASSGLPHDDLYLHLYIYIYIYILYLLA